MKIAVCGAQNVGKTTFIEDIGKECPEFIIPAFTYRDVINRKGIADKINRQTCMESQKIIFDAIAECTRLAPDNSIIDRSVIDAVAYTWWPVRFKEGETDITSDFADRLYSTAIGLLDELDLIIYIPTTDDVPIEEDTLRDTNLEYREQIAQIFEELLLLDIDDPLFDKYGYKVVTITGTREERVADFKEFIQTIAK